MYLSLPPGDIALSLYTQPAQPIGIKFHITYVSNKPRSANPAWLKLYPWLEYLIQYDICFYFPCRFFENRSVGYGSSRIRREVTFVVN